MRDHNLHAIFPIRASSRVRTKFYSNTNNSDRSESVGKTIMPRASWHAPGGHLYVHIQIYDDDDDDSYTTLPFFAMVLLPYYLTTHTALPNTNEISSVFETLASNN